MHRNLPGICQPAHHESLREQLHPRSQSFQRYANHSDPDDDDSSHGEHSVHRENPGEVAEISAGASEIRIRLPGSAGGDSHSEHQEYPQDSGFSSASSSNHVGSSGYPTTAAGPAAEVPAIVIRLPERPDRPQGRPQPQVSDSTLRHDPTGIYSQTSGVRPVEAVAPQPHQRSGFYYLPHGTGHTFPYLAIISPISLGENNNCPLLADIDHHECVFTFTTINTLSAPSVSGVMYCTAITIRTTISLFEGVTRERTGSEIHNYTTDMPSQPTSYRPRYNLEHSLILHVYRRIRDHVPSLRLRISLFSMNSGQTV